MKHLKVMVTLQNAMQYCQYLLHAHSHITRAEKMARKTSK